MAYMSPLRRRMIEDMTVRNLSPATQRCYVHAVTKFSQYFGRSPDRLGLEDVRASEAVHLKVGDIDSGRMVIRVEHGTGGKDRYVMLSQQLLGILRTYWRLARPKHWLFPGRYNDRPIEPNVLHAACRQACAAAGLTKKVTVHTLRHSFATHSGERHRHSHHPGPDRPQ